MRFFKGFLPALSICVSLPWVTLAYAQGIVTEGGPFNLLAEPDLVNCIEIIQPPGRYAEGIAVSLHNKCGKWIMWIMGPLPFKAPFGQTAQEGGYVCNNGCAQVEDIPPDGYPNVADDYIQGRDTTLVCNIPPGDDPLTEDMQTAFAQVHAEWDRCINLYDQHTGSFTGEDPATVQRLQSKLNQSLQKANTANDDPFGGPTNSAPANAPASNDDPFGSPSSSSLSSNDDPFGAGNAH